ncbi:GNAT family N-acetyltransferase [Antrihabitans stalactiti]|nr:GNAT family N-acetyltransferase [Antrihabitans stalactiti]
MNTVSITRLEPAHVDGLRLFLAQSSAGDRTYFRDDVLANGVVDSWLARTTGAYHVALVEGEVAGLLVLEPGVEWGRHVGEIRIVVAQGFRRRGIGRALARRALIAGLELDLDKLVVQVAAEDEATTSMFVTLAFEPEALLRGHVRDDSGDTHDLLVLAHFVESTRGAVAAIGLAEAMEM